MMSVLERLLHSIHHIHPVTLNVKFFTKKQRTKEEISEEMISHRIDRRSGRNYNDWKVQENVQVDDYNNLKDHCEGEFFSQICS